MNTIISDLLVLQQILQRGDRASAAEKMQRQQLEKKIPPPFLAHFVRLRMGERRGVAVVRNGICGECHIKLPSATVDNLRRSEDVQLCESCGCYLALPADSLPAVKEPVTAPPVEGRRRGRGRPALVVA